MKALLLIYHGFSPYSGISKKIAAQCDALCAAGIETIVCHTEIDADGRQRRYAGERVIGDFGSGLRAKLLKRFRLGDIVRYVEREDIRLVYVRHDFNASPLTVRLLRRLRQAGARIALEIPTYPYDAEFAAALPAERLRHAIDRLFRRRMARYADRIVTFSDDAEIFARPTVRISNGIDFASVALHEARPRDEQFRLLAVANIHRWHGLDRAIEGLGRYYAAPHARQVHLRIVGDSTEAIFDDLRARIARWRLEPFVTLTGPLSGAALDEAFDWCDMGIGSLGRHRNGIRKLKTLKNREYAARGIPFVYSEQDDDFDAMPYVVKAPADDSPLDIARLVRFCDGLDSTPAAIRASVEGQLSWRHQMRRVLAALFPNQFTEP